MLSVGSKRPPREHRDRGSVLVSVLVVAMVLGVLAVAISTAVVNTAKVTADVRSTLQAQAAADAGTAAGFARATAAGPGLCPSPTHVDDDFVTSDTAPVYRVALTCAPGSVTLTSTGEGEDGGVSVVDSVYDFTGTVVNGSPNGAVVIGGGSIAASAFVLDGNDIEDASAVLMSGDFNTCNSTTKIEADLVLLSGKLNLTNTCTFDGDVYVNGEVEGSAAAAITGVLFSTGDVTLTNSTLTIGGITAKGDVIIHGHVHGDVIAEGNVIVQGGAVVNGNVAAGGTVKLNDATVIGDVTGASAGASDVFNVKIGSIRVGGYFTQFGSAKVTRGILAAKAGATSRIAGSNGVEIGPASTIVLGGPIDTWGSNAWSSRLTQNATGLSAPVAPTINMPPILNASQHPWVDYSFIAADWVASDYEILTYPATKCDFQNNPSYVTELRNLTDPTVVDLRACPGVVKFYNVKLALDTDLVFVLPDNGKSHDFQSSEFTSGDAEAHKLTLIVPDDTSNAAPTCKNSGSELNIYHAKLGSSPMVSGLAYTPCKLRAGTSGSEAGWNGQLYTGTLDMLGSGTAYTLTYVPAEVPGFGIGGSTPPEIGGLTSRRDVGAR